MKRRSANPASSSSPPKQWPHLPAGARDLVVAIALHGPALPVAWVDSFTDQPEDVDTLLRCGLIAETSGAFELGSDVDRTKIHRTASWTQRRRLHLLLAAACQQSPARQEWAGKHFEAAGRLPEAARAYLAAAEFACRRHHHRVATRCFTTGLRLTDASAADEEIVRAIQGLERCASLTAESQAAIVQLQDWRTAPVWRARLTLQAEASLALASLLARDGRNVESARERSDAAARLTELGRPADATTAALAAAGTLTFAANYVAGRTAAEIAVRAASTLDDPAMVAQAALTHGLILGMLGETDAGRAEVERCLEVAMRERLTGIAAEAYRFLGTVAEYASCYEDEQTAFANALKFCHRQDQTITAGMCMGCLSYSFLRSGNWKRSETTARRVVSDRKIPEFSRSIAECVLGLLHAHRGETRPATRHLKRSLERCRAMGFVVMDFFNLLGLALVAETRSRDEEAAQHYLALLETWRSTDDRHDVIPALTSAVSFFAERNRADQAAAAAEALEAIAATTANPEAAGAARLAAGELLCLEGQPERGVAELRRALAAYDQRALSVEPIRVRMRLADALQKIGGDEEAHELLQEARQRARRLGARPLLARIDAILTGAPETYDAPMPTANPAAWELLSARQREVARQLAKGRTNKEIAAQLSVSVRTVDMHVAHVLDRLDCRTRAEAAAQIAAALV